MTTSKTKETKETKKRVELQQTKTCSSGIELRHWSNGNKTIRITFQYQGICCRETLNLEPTASNIKYAANLRGEIINAITRGTFSYPHYFPNSKKAKMFGYNSSSATVKELIENYLNQAQRSLQFSTFRSYRLNCYSHLIPTFGNLPIKQLTPAIIRNWITTLKTTAKTLRNVLTPLRNVIEIAITDQIIDSNPLEKVIISRLLDKDRVNNENIMWLSKQMGHADIEMIMRTYGKWIPDSSIKAGYRPVNNWGMYLEEQKEEPKNGDKESKATIKTPKNDILEPLKSNLSA